MTELIRIWVFGLTAAAFLGTIAMTITPNGRVKAVVGLVCGLVMVVALIAPVIDFDNAVYATHLARAEADLALHIQEIEHTRERLTQAIISERVGAYIWDKATQLGLILDAIEVTTAQDEAGNLWPTEVFLVTRPGTEEQVDTLRAWIENTFDIPPERQHWRRAE